MEASRRQGEEPHVRTYRDTAQLGGDLPQGTRPQPCWSKVLSCDS